ncbi:hypothetical protein PFAG_04099 [Plasmodium falciparum Santa Lucia]|uniref:Uncharacterized protein n=3 Tax=Plasmodium falciparum TaxID=5833 RepID=A0A024V486_PLAFA|nr:hypothetical protein PFFVO_03711 [Plasmodium falciparum Vietnam Oak-Knoll (FVO)]ETW41271.1 hypothetical protein PFNF135_04256 [Plasmodium falciparum NF135/5.C10]EUT81918.1 hypothetical protein PFAG_04099 [Plasmodium falciparum Santa Lucia]
MYYYNFYTYFFEYITKHMKNAHFHLKKNNYVQIYFINHILYENIFYPVLNINLNNHHKEIK